MNRLHFLVDANLPTVVAATLTASGHAAAEVAVLFPPGTSDQTVAAHARMQRLTLVTRDVGFADVRAYPPSEYHGIVVFRTPDKAPRSVLAQFAQRLLADPVVVRQHPGRLVVMDQHRIRVRPPLR